MTRFVDVPTLSRFVHDIGLAVELAPWVDDPKDLLRYTRAGASRPVMRRVA